MITSVENIQRLVHLLDEIVTTRPHSPLPVIALTSDECEAARIFLKEYDQRLSGDDKDSLVPHAFADRASRNASTESRMPDVELIDKLVNELKNTIPPGAGRRPRFPSFASCHDVITANNIDGSGEEERRRRLCDHLYRKWEGRTPGLNLIQNMLAAEVLGKMFHVIIKVIFLGMNRQWFERRLDRRRLSWFGKHVKGVNENSNFLAHALEVAPGGRAYGETDLRCKILLDALLADLDHLTRRRRYLPHHRRRRWTPVLALDCTGTNENICLVVARSLVELYGRKSNSNRPPSPLLVIAAINRTDKLGPGCGPPISTTDAAEWLRKYATNPSSLGAGPACLSVLLDPKSEPSGIPYRPVTHRVPGTLSAWAPVAITAVIALAGATIVADRYFFADCAHTWYNDSGERVGLSDGKCEFTPVAEEPVGFPDLRDLERKIRENNARVDDLKGPLGYRYVVFFAPLTRPDHVVERTQPANALWQLSGAVKAQKELNELAETDAEKVPIKLLLANSGDLFEEGPNVASVIVEQPLDGPGSIAGIIGISQSRIKAMTAFDRMPGVPVVGATLTGNRMTENREANFFMVSPPNSAFADKMTEWVRDNKLAMNISGWTNVYDPQDVLFSKDLRDSLQGALSKELGSPGQAKDVVLSERISSTNGTTDDIVRTLCENAQRGILPVLTVRADQLAKIFTAGDHLSECNGNGNKITMIAGPGAIVAAASDRVDKHRWLNLVYPVLAGTAKDSEEATGNDALRVVSEAINKSARYSGGNPNAAGVLNYLRDGFDLEGKTGRLHVAKGDRKDPSSDRIRILETHRTGA